MSYIQYLIPKKEVKLREDDYLRSAAQIHDRIAQGPNRGDFWDKVIEKSDFDKGTGLTKDEMVSNASLLVLAGSETTATLLSGTTYLLLKNQDKYQKLVSEVRDGFNSQDEIDMNSVGKLDYMLAVLDEAMRLYPPVPHQGNRIVLRPGIMIDGKWVPPGASRGLSAA